MSNLQVIAHRHRWNRWKDALFIGAALLMTTVALGSVTSRAAGKAPSHAWSVTVIESDVEPVVAASSCGLAESPPEPIKPAALSVIGSCGK